jgi:hypothetical protein
MDTEPTKPLPQSSVSENRIDAVLPVTVLDLPGPLIVIPTPL